MSHPLISPALSETTCTVAPAAFNLSRGTSSSDCSKPCVARMAIFFLSSCMDRSPKVARPTRAMEQLGDRSSTNLRSASKSPSNLRYPALNAAPRQRLHNAPMLQALTAADHHHHQHP